MRHIGSLLVAAVFAPSIFLLTGTGLSAFNSALDDNKAYDPLGSLAAFGALLLAGVLYAILVMSRLSPLGPALAGLASWGISGWALFDIDAYHDLFSQLDVHMGGAVGETGLGILLGVPLVATLFSGRRWRRSELSLPPPTARTATDPTWLLPAAPVYQSSAFRSPVMPEVPLPDIPPPSLRYPLAAAFPARSVSAPPVSTPPVPAPPVPAPPVSTPPVPAPPLAGPPAPASSGTPVAETLASAPASDAPLPDSPVSGVPVSGPPAPITMVPSDEAPPLPKRVPSPPPGGEAATEPSAPSPADDEVTERLAAALRSVQPEARPKPAAAGNEDETDTSPQPHAGS